MILLDGMATLKHYLPIIKHYWPVVQSIIWIIFYGIFIYGVSRLFQSAESAFPNEIPITFGFDIVQTIYGFITSFIKKLATILPWVYYGYLLFAIIREMKFIFKYITRSVEGTLYDYTFK